ncbi:MAG: hypothetical protein CMG75_10185 [Candidatus Marinimicrobia bacterium]|nr:hypothetical protein [Candidatus Neomarinimicrobiota bacterium]|tara:strand:+ start:5307 stop:6395 length:1089 start_codon:yes stop_codon:yes gene_type:complete
MILLSIIKRPFLLLFLLWPLIFGQDNNSSSLLLTSQQDLDICKSAVYILQNDLPKRTSKKISKKLSKQVRRVKKGLKIKKRYYNTDCESIDCVVEDMGKTKATHAFVLDNNVNTLGTDKGIVLRELLYDFNSDKLKPTAQFDLLLLLGLLEDYPKMNLELSSHTDTRGLDSYNLDLSQRRANSVVKWLTDNGVNPDRLEAVGYGESSPAKITSQQEDLYPFLKEGDILTIDYINSLGSTENQNTAHALNRRTEVSITNTGFRNIMGGSIDLMLLDLDKNVLLSEVSTDFIGSNKDIYSRIENMSSELVANFAIDKCKRGFGLLFIPIIILGGGAGYYAYTEIMSEESGIGDPPILPEDCCGK